MTVNYVNSSGLGGHTSQSQPLIGRLADMHQNQAGGFVFTLSPMQTLKRFLILGTEGGTFYASEKEATHEATENLLHCVTRNGLETVRTIKDVSTRGLAYKQNPAIFALALAFAKGDPLTRQEVRRSFNAIVRTGTHLFLFAKYATALRGWGRSLRRAVQDWYLSKDARAVAYQVTKYASREGWTHRDLLRLAHVKPDTEEMNAVLAFAANRIDQFDLYKGNQESIRYLRGVLEVKDPKVEPGDALDVIADLKLPREVVPDALYNLPDIRKQVYDNMNFIAMVRNLGAMSASGHLTPNSDFEKRIVDELTNAGKVRGSKVHPLQMLAAYFTYLAGKGARGNLTWTPCQAVIGAVEQTFIASMENVDPCNKRFVIGVDVSPSMDFGEINGIPGLTPRIMAAVTALIIMKKETRVFCGGFADTFAEIPMNSGSSPRQARKAMQEMRGFQGTDAAIPIQHAMDNNIPADCFVIITDNETWSGNRHPTEALNEYRKKMGVPAKLISVGLTATRSSIADPADPGQLDVVGCTPDLLSIITGFAKGEF